GLKIERPVRDVTDAAVDAYRQRFLEQYGAHEDHDGEAESGDYVTLSAEFRYQGRPLHKVSEFRTQIKPVLRFQDAELEGFDTLMTGARPGDVIPAEITVSTEAENIEMRGETVQANLTVKGVRRVKMPELNNEFFERIGFDDVEELDEEIRSTLERQVQYQQRQSCRSQVLEKITESADWDLPEELVLKQVENALRREILEMQQAGFTSDQIRSRENEIRQRAVSTTERALKEHFVLDKIASQENIEVAPDEIDSEIRMMAKQRGESARRVRARLERSGMDENLLAQIRERKAVDFLIERAEFIDVPIEEPAEDRIAAVPHSVCGMKIESARDEEEGEDGQNANE
ncbi:MAG: trigger factor, partial [Planctomycetaceae bacterium]